MAPEILRNCSARLVRHTTLVLPFPPSLLPPLPSPPLPSRPPQSIRPPSPVRHTCTHGTCTHSVTHQLQRTLRRGSVAYDTHTPDKEIAKHQVVTQTVGTRNADTHHRCRGAPCSRRISWSCRLFSTRSATSSKSHSPTEGLQLLQLCNAGHERRQWQLQQRGSGRLPADRRDPRLPRPTRGCPYFVSPTPKYRPDTDRS